MEAIKVQIDADPLSGVAREVEMFQLIIKRNREMELVVDIYHKDAEGVRLIDKVNTLDIDDKMKASMANMYAPRRRTHETVDVRVNSATGLYANDGDMTELEYLHSLTPGQVQAMFPDQNSFLGLIHDFIQARIETMNVLKKYG